MSNSSILPITCDTLGELDYGASRAIIDAAIRDAINDLQDRGEDGKPRKVAITITFGLLDNGLVEAKVEAIAKVPMRKTASTIGEVQRDGRNHRVAFRKYSPEDPAQTTIEEFENGDDGRIPQAHPQHDADDEGIAIPAG